MNARACNLSIAMDHLATKQARSAAFATEPAACLNYVPPAVEARLAAWAGTIMVEAPAGFGKTALLASLGRTAAAAGRTAVYFTARACPTLCGLDGHIAELSGPAADRPVLMIDDAHLLESPVFKALDRLIDGKAAGIQLIVASREPVPIGVARRVVANDAVLLTAGDLGLHDDAIARLLAADNLAGQDLRVTIARLAGGWPAGVRIAVSEAQSGAIDRTSMLDHLTRHDGTLDRFLSEEVIESLDPETIDNLHVLGTLGRFSPALLQFATGIENSAEAIARIERRGLFVRPVRDDLRVMNPMVSACLEARLRRTDPSRSRDLHIAAAQWYERERQLSDAISHAFAGGDAERAADLLAQSSSTHERIGRWRAFTDWTSRLNDEILDRYRAIRLEAAPAHAVLFEFAAARLHLAKLTDPVAQMSMDEAASLLGAQAIFAAFSDQPGAALEAGEKGRTSTVAVDAYTRGVFYTASALGRIADGEIATAHELSVEARAIHERGGSAFGATFALALSGLTLAIGAKLQEAVDHWREGARLIRPTENAPALEAVATGYLPLALYEWNEVAEAQSLIERCLASSVEVALPDAIASIYVTASRIAAARGDFAGVERWANEGMSLAVRRQWSRLYNAAAWEAITLALRRGQSSEARQLKKRLDRERRFAGGAIVGLDVEGNCGALRYDLRVRGDRAAFNAMRAEISRARGEGRLWRAARLLAIEADARERLGDRAGALRALRRALEIGQAGRLIRTFVDEGAEVVALILRIAIEEERAPKPSLDLGYLDEILEVGGTHRLLSDADSLLVEPLSKREAEVLTMASAGLSNRTIGERLFMSENTVKWHLQHVFAKLGAANRTSAIVVARHHGFIA